MCKVVCRIFLKLFIFNSFYSFDSFFSVIFSYILPCPPRRNSRADACTRATEGLCHGDVEFKTKRVVRESIHKYILASGTVYDRQ